MTDFAGMASLPILGRIAVYRGVEHRARLATGSDLVTLYMDRNEWDVFESDDEVSRGHPVDPEMWVKVKRRSLSRLFMRRALARWFDIEVDVAGPVGPETVLVTYDGDPRRAEARGMKGSQFESWRADVRFAELSNIRIVEE